MGETIEFKYQEVDPFVNDDFSSSDGMATFVESSTSLNFVISNRSILFSFLAKSVANASAGTVESKGGACMVLHLW
ncbi:MAG: hypothetical protein ABR985_22235 [Methanotrichaceae archaeon]|jgi:hypothetical protein